jgi:hypothetical protein
MENLLQICAQLADIENDEDRQKKAVAILQNLNLPTRKLRELVTDVKTLTSIDPLTGLVDKTKTETPGSHTLYHALLGFLQQD